MGAGGCGVGALAAPCSRGSFEARVRDRARQTGWKPAPLVMGIAVLVAVMGARGEILDRIAVSVARQVITERDVIRDLRVTAFLDHRKVEESGEQKRAAADRIVDQVLILNEAAQTRVALATEDDARKMLAGVKAQYGADYAGALKRYGISEQDVVDHLLAGLRAMRFTDLRFRPEVQISEDDLREAYDSLKANGKGTLPSFEASREQIEKLLTDQRTAQALDRWLGTQRTDTQILYHEQVFE